VLPAPAPSTFEIGAVVGETYTIEAELGRGGMGIVWLASHARLPGKQVAIKVLHAQAANADVLARFKREAHIVSVLAHPNIVHVEDYNVTADGTPYLVLEYLRGESLAERLARGPLELALALSIARQIGAALSAAHARNIVHRDLKPQNVFLVPTGDTLVAKVLDFGISKLLDSDTVRTDDNSLLGTPQYMAPEQATGQSEAIGVRTDVFSLGAIVYEMLSGRPAFAGKTLAEVVFKAVYEQPAALSSDLPPTVTMAISRAMAKAPADRFDSVNRFIETLTGPRAVSPGPVGAARGRVDELAMTVDSTNVPEGVFTIHDPAPTRRRRTAIVAACAVGVGVIGIVAFLALRGPARAELDRARLRTVAAQLPAGGDVLLDGKRYRIGMTPHQLHIVKFEVDGHPYEAVEQNPDKPSRWGRLAREHHRVIQFRDLATNRYIAVVVDGEPRRSTEAEPDEP